MATLYSNQAKCYFATGNNEEAIYNFKKSLQNQNDNPKTYFSLSQIYNQTGHMDEMVNILKSGQKVFKEAEIADLAEEFQKKIDQHLKQQEEMKAAEEGQKNSNKTKS